MSIFTILTNDSTNYIWEICSIILTGFVAAAFIYCFEYWKDYKNKKNIEIIFLENESRKIMLNAVNVSFLKEDFSSSYLLSLVKLDSKILQNANNTIIKDIIKDEELILKKTYTKKVYVSNLTLFTKYNRIFNEIKVTNKKLSNKLHVEHNIYAYIMVELCLRQLDILNKNHNMRNESFYKDLKRIYDEYWNYNCGQADTA